MPAHATSVAVKGPTQISRLVLVFVLENREKSFLTAGEQGCPYWMLDVECSMFPTREDENLGGASLPMRS
jgi:hypothetical protein